MSVTVLRFISAMRRNYINTDTHMWQFYFALAIVVEVLMRGS